MIGPGRSMFAGGVAALFALVGTGACSVVLGIGDLTDTGGGVTPGTCDTPSDCPPPPNACVTMDCDDHTCVSSPLSAGTMLASQLKGDCQVAICDGSGNVTTQPDPNDFYDDGNDCTKDSCIGSTRSNRAIGVGAPCKSDHGRVCNRLAECVECNGDGDCETGQRCDKAEYLCISASCVVDGKQSSGETDVDCGGTNCPPCEPGKHCLVDGDCTSKVCSGMPLECQPPSCTDHVLNGNESDVDCGAPCPEKCLPGEHCNSGADCFSHVCSGGLCQNSTCTDDVKNEDETDVDCGGMHCKGCSDGKKCLVGADCYFGGCNDGICDHCVSGKMDGGETGVDCGGTCPKKCGTGQGCAVNSDCADGRCCNMKCSDLTVCQTGSP